MQTAGEEGGDGWAIGLDAWASLDMAQRLRLLAAGYLPMEHQRAQLAKLLERVQPTQRIQLLVNLLEHLAPLRLQWCADFLRQEAQQPQVTGVCPRQVSPPIHDSHSVRTSRLQVVAGEAESKEVDPLLKPQMMTFIKRKCPRNFLVPSNLYISPSPSTAAD